MSFLPANYKEPVVSNYMRFEKGDNRFRILSHAIIGWEWWEDGENGSRKPFRVRMDGVVPSGTDTKHFWAFPVYNYQDEKVQILEITQKGIQRSIKALAQNVKWGDPKEYDIVVTRTGDGMETEYNTVPEPKEKLDDKIWELYESMEINTEALYDSGDPFAKDVEEKYTNEGNKDEIDIEEIKF
jgi:hypothetical protein